MHLIHGVLAFLGRYRLQELVLEPLEQADHILTGHVSLLGHLIVNKRDHLQLCGRHGFNLGHGRLRNDLVRVEGHCGGGLPLLLPILIYPARALLLRSHELVGECVCSVVLGMVNGRRLIGFLLLVLNALDDEPVCKLALLVHKILKCRTALVGALWSRLLLREAVHNFSLDLLDEVLCPQNRIFVDDFSATAAISTAVRLRALTQFNPASLIDCMGVLGGGRGRSTTSSHASKKIISFLEDLSPLTCLLCYGLLLLQLLLRIHRLKQILGLFLFLLSA